MEAPKEKVDEIVKKYSDLNFEYNRSIAKLKRETGYVPVIKVVDGSVCLVFDFYEIQCVVNGEPLPYAKKEYVEYKR